MHGKLASTILDQYLLQIIEFEVDKEIQIGKIIVNLILLSSITSKFIILCYINVKHSEILVNH